MGFIGDSVFDHGMEDNAFESREVLGGGGQTCCLEWAVPARGGRWTVLCVWVGHIPLWRDVGCRWRYRRGMVVGEVE